MMDLDVNDNKFLIEVNQTEKIPMVLIQGELDVHTSPKLNQALSKLIEESHTSLLLNLEKVHYIDSTGLGTIAHIARQIQEKNGQILLISNKPQLKKIFEMSGLQHKNVHLFENETNAREKLS